MQTIGESHSFLHALCVRPGIKFENQQKEEEVILSLRAHPITLIPTVVNSIVMFLLTFFLGYIIGPFLNIVQLTYIMVFFYFVTFFYFWFQAMNWYFNIGIVTNKQIIDVDFSVLTYRNVSRTELSHIEDITVKTSGFISSIFNYGNVFVQTAGSEINTEFLQVPNPAGAAHIIQDILKDNGRTK